MYCRNIVNELILEKDHDLEWVMLAYLGFGSISVTIENIKYQFWHDHQEIIPCFCHHFTVYSYFPQYWIVRVPQNKTRVDFIFGFLHFTVDCMSQEQRWYLKTSLLPSFLHFDSKGESEIMLAIWNNIIYWNLKNFSACFSSPFLCLSNVKPKQRFMDFA